MQRIVPNLWFDHTAAEAADFYTSVFGGRLGTVAPYPAEAGPMAGQVMFGEFQALDQWFATMDAAGQDFTLTCGDSLMVYCHGQEELDRYWAELSAVAEAEQCGWCADKFGLSWQLVPDNLDELMGKPGAFEKLMQMGKIEIAAFG